MNKTPARTQVGADSRAGEGDYLPAGEPGRAGRTLPDDEESLIFARCQRSSNQAADLMRAMI